MNFLGQVVIIVAMALVAISFGGLSYLLLGLKLDTSMLASFSGFALMVIFQTAVWRTRERQQTNRDLQGLNLALENITRDVAILKNKMTAYDHAGVVRATQDVIALRSGMQTLEAEMQQANATLHQHYELIQAVRTPTVFGQKRAGQEGLPPVVEQQPEEAPVASAPQPPPRRRGRLAHLDDRAAAELIRTTIDEGRIELLLQPVVSLPQRRIRQYEILSRLKTAAGDALLPEDFLPFLQKGNLGITFDTLVLYRAVQLVRRMQTRNKEIGVTINLCGATLSGGEEFRSLVEFLEANRALSDSLTLEISQGTYNDMSPLEFESIHAITQLGFAFSLDQARDLRLDVKALAERGFRSIKVPADVLLGRTTDQLSDIHPEDLGNLLARYGIDLIADKIESEATVIELLDYNVGYAQGFLFAPPRPVKADVLDDDLADGTRAALSA